MKVCILSVGELKHMVMISIYTYYLDKRGIPYDVVYMDRYHKKEESTAEKIYRYEINASSYFSKLIGYFFFRRYAKKKLNSTKYDLIVIWNEFTAVLFERYLSKNFKGKYSINVRDLFDEDAILRNPRILNPRLARSIKQSAFTTVSSEKYIDYLVPFDKYYFIHSINRNILPEAKSHDIQSNRLKILYIGKIGYFEEIKKFLKSLANDDRYVLKFAGIGSEIVKEYAEAIGCKNVEFIGIFESNRTIELLKEADVIYNLYGYRKICERTALSNKLYYAVCLNVPILVYRNTFMYDIANECGIAFPADDFSSNQLGDQLYIWYQSIDWEIVHKRCSEFIAKALDSQTSFYNVLEQYFNNL